VRRSRALALVAVAAALLLTACSADEADTAVSPAGADAGQADASPVEPATSVPGGTASDGATLARVSVASSAVVRTGEIDVRVDDVRRAADAAARLARDAGGVVSSEQTEADRGDGDARATLLLRVPPERFDAVVDGVAALGAELQRSVATEEVGEELIDLESRVATQRASVERVRALLAEADDLAQVVQIEGELTRRTADLESLQARLAALRDRVARSALTVRLDSAEAAPEPAGALGFLDGLRGGWEAFVATARAVAVTVGAVLPFLPFVALAGYAVLRSRRRRPAGA
jgi:uncharacterized coiled-coil protein SlyX